MPAAVSGIGTGPLARVSARRKLTSVQRLRMNLSKRAAYARLMASRGTSRRKVASSMSRKLFYKNAVTKAKRTRKMRAKKYGLRHQVKTLMDADMVTQRFGIVRMPLLKQLKSSLIGGTATGEASIPASYTGLGIVNGSACIIPLWALCKYINIDTYSNTNATTTIKESWTTAQQGQVSVNTTSHTIHDPKAVPEKLRYNISACNAVYTRKGSTTAPIIAGCNTGDLKRKLAPGYTCKLRIAIVRLNNVGHTDLVRDFETFGNFSHDVWKNPSPTGVTGLPQTGREPACVKPIWRPTGSFNHCAGSVISDHGAKYNFNKDMIVPDVFSSYHEPLCRNPVPVLPLNAMSPNKRYVDVTDELGSGHTPFDSVTGSRFSNFFEKGFLTGPSVAKVWADKTFTFGTEGVSTFSNTHALTEVSSRIKPEFNHLHGQIPMDGSSFTYMSERQATREGRVKVHFANTDGIFRDVDGSSITSGRKLMVQGHEEEQDYMNVLQYGAPTPQAAATPGAVEPMQPTGIITDAFMTSAVPLSVSDVSTVRDDLIQPGDCVVRSIAADANNLGRRLPVAEIPLNHRYAVVMACQYYFHGQPVASVRVVNHAFDGTESITTVSNPACPIGFNCNWTVRQNKLHANDHDPMITTDALNYSSVLSMTAPFVTTNRQNAADTDGTKLVPEPNADDTDHA